MQIFQLIKDDDTLLLTRSDDNSSIVKCTLEYKEIWLALASSPKSQGQSKDRPQTEVTDFLHFLEERQLLPVASYDEAVQIANNLNIALPFSGEFSEENVEVYAQDGGPSPGHTHTVDSFGTGCWTPGTYYEDACF